MFCKEGGHSSDIPSYSLLILLHSFIFFFVVFFLVHSGRKLWPTDFSFFKLVPWKLTDTGTDLQLSRINFCYGYRFLSPFRDLSPPNYWYVIPQTEVTMETYRYRSVISSNSLGKSFRQRGIIFLVYLLENSDKQSVYLKMDEEGGSGDGHSFGRGGLAWERWGLQSEWEMSSLSLYFRSSCWTSPLLKVSVSAVLENLEMPDSKITGWGLKKAVKHFLGPPQGWGH